MFGLGDFTLNCWLRSFSASELFTTCYGTPKSIIWSHQLMKFASISMTNMAIGNRSWAKMLYWNLELKWHRQKNSNCSDDTQFIRSRRFLHTCNLLKQHLLRSNSIYNISAVWELFVCECNECPFFLRSPTFRANCVLFAKCLSSQWEQHPWWHELGSARRRWVCTYFRAEKCSDFN